MQGEKKNDPGGCFISARLPRFRGQFISLSVSKPTDGGPPLFAGLVPRARGRTEDSKLTGMQVEVSSRSDATLSARELGLSLFLSALLHEFNHRS